MFSGIRPKAILIGIVADIGATYLIMAVLMVSLGAGARDLSEEEARQLIESALQQPSYLLLSGALGLLATALGGFVAAKVAIVAPLLNAACVGLFDLVLGVLLIGDAPLWFTAMALLLTLPAAIMGGVLWRRAAPGQPR
jgi:predicted phage tail protein